MEEEVKNAVENSVGEEQGVIDRSKVDIAVRFLNNHNVRETSLECKEAFLKKKGLTDAEISEAILNSAALQAEEGCNGDDRWGLSTYLKVLVFGTVVLSAVNYAYKTYILPYLAHEIKNDERIEALSESVENLKNGINQHTSELSQTLKNIQDLFEEQRSVLQSLKHADVDATASDIKTELSSIKCMLLSRNQFPTAPFVTVQKEIPAWQLATEETTENACRE